MSQKNKIIDLGLLIGKWQWLESRGGIGGWHLTPESEGYTKIVVFTQNQYEEFVNDSLTMVSSYNYDQKKNLLSIGTAADNIFQVKLCGDTLRLHPVFVKDDFDHTYVKIIQIIE